MDFKTDMDTKLFVVNAATSVFALQHVSDTDSAPEANQEQTELHRGILDGADPTDILEPTASGEQTIPLCSSGVIATSSRTQHLEARPYVSYKVDETTYILIDLPAPLYLKQSPSQATTADAITPSTSTLQQLTLFHETSARCELVDLYLSRINWQG